jgi:hypothetical protein
VSVAPISNASPAIAQHQLAPSPIDWHNTL